MPTVPYKYLKDENFQPFYPMIGASSFDEPVSVSDGGTGADTAAGARANLGAISATDAALVAGNVPFILDVAEGGTGATTADVAIVNLGACKFPTSFADDSTTSSSSQITTEYTVNGNGFLIVTASVWTDSTTDTGTMQARVFLNDIMMAASGNRLATANAANLGECVTIAIIVQNGDKIKIQMGASKNGDKSLYRKILCFGCTVS